MRVCGIGLLSIKPNFINSYKNSSTDKPVLNVLQYDTVSFKSKGYDSDSIKNPTGHCAYCGVKIYTDKQLEEKAKMLANNKPSKLQGELRSIRDKFELQRNSGALDKAWKEQNLEEIAFFKQLFNLSKKHKDKKAIELIRSHILTQDATEAEVVELIKKNLKPVLATIDHVSPQRLKKGNYHNEMNLVEACNTCNHDIKNGLTPEEFFELYPTAKNYMDKEKYDFAAVNGLESSSQIDLVEAADDLVDRVENLKKQLVSARNRIGTIEFQIEKCKTSIDNMQDAVVREQAEIRLSILDLEDQQKLLRKNEDYMTLVSKLKMASKIKKQKAELRKFNRNQPEYSTLAGQISTNETKLSVLANAVPSLDKLVKERNSLQEELNLHSKQESNQSRLNTLTEEKNKLEQQLDEILNDLDRLNEEVGYKSTTPKNASKKISKYNQLVGQLAYVKNNLPANGSEREIYNTAKRTLEKEISELEELSFILRHKNKEKFKILNQKRNELNQSLKQVNNKLQSCLNVKEVTDSHPLSSSKEKLEEQIEGLNAQIKYITELKEGLKIKDKIEHLRVEHNLLEKAYLELDKERASLEQPL